KKPRAQHRGGGRRVMQQAWLPWAIGRRPARLRQRGLARPGSAAQREHLSRFGFQDATWMDGPQGLVVGVPDTSAPMPAGMNGTAPTSARVLPGETRTTHAGETCWVQPRAIGPAARFLTAASAAVTANEAQRAIAKVNQRRAVISPSLVMDL